MTKNLLKVLLAAGMIAPFIVACDEDGLNPPNSGWTKTDIQTKEECEDADAQSVVHPYEWRESEQGCYVGTNTRGSLTLNQVATITLPAPPTPRQPAPAPSPEPYEPTPIPPLDDVLDA